MSETYDHKSMMGRLDDLMVTINRTGGHVSTSVQGLSDKIRESNKILEQANVSAETANGRIFWLTLTIAIFAGIEAISVLSQVLHTWTKP